MVGTLKVDLSNPPSLVVLESVCVPEAASLQLTAASANASRAACGGRVQHTQAAITLAVTASACVRQTHSAHSLHSTKYARS